MGDHVVLVQADLHKPNLPAVSEESFGRGLSAVLVDHATLDEALFELPVLSPSRRQESRVLTILSSGALPPNPSELLESKQMHALLSELESRFDFVVIDSPPVSLVSDALALVPQASGVLVVTAIGRTTRTSIGDFRRQMTFLRARPFGIVVNFSAPETAYYHRYGPDPRLSAEQAASPVGDASRRAAGRSPSQEAPDFDAGTQRLHS
jgi:capsular exopolysaccharide synthesis family protein